MKSDMIARMSNHRFLVSDVGKCRSQNLRMIQANISQDTYFVWTSDDIASIIVATQASLYHRNLYTTSRKSCIGTHHQHFKITQSLTNILSSLDDHWMYQLQQVSQLCRTDLLSLYNKSLCDMNQMRRNSKSDLISQGTETICKILTSRTLA